MRHPQEEHSYVCNTSSAGEAEEVRLDSLHNEEEKVYFASV
jgi:hypothetical protein